MYGGLQKRAHERLPSSCQFRVYTSVSRMGYSVDLIDVSRSGAFVVTKHMPSIGETINIEVMDSYGKKLFNLSAKVKNHRSISNEYGTVSGFGAMFPENLSLKELEIITGSGDN